MPRFFIDANTLISGLVFSGPEHQLLRKGAAGKVELVTSEDVIEELIEVINRKFPDKSHLVKESLKLAELKIIRKAEYASMVDEQQVRDLEDRHILAAALAAKCKLIVTGDRDLLTLKAHQGIKIIRTFQALNEITRATQKSVGGAI